MKKVLIIMLLFFLIPTCNVDAATFSLADDVKGAILIEEETGEILFEKQKCQRLQTASMTKIMTLLLVLDAKENGLIKETDIIRASKHAVSMGGTQIYLKEGEEMSFIDLLKSVAIASANDAAVALAEHVYGTEEMFVKKMNDKAAELKLENTNFVNVTGLTAANHYSCALDMAIIARHLISKHGNYILNYTNCYDDYIRKETDNPFWLVNTNKLIKTEWIFGLKTGVFGD